MNKKKLREMKQLASFTYFSSKDEKFRTHNPLDSIRGEICVANTYSRLEELLYPFSFEEAKTILRDAHREHDLNLKIFEVSPPANYWQSSKRFGGIVTSSTHMETKYRFPHIRNAFDPQRVEFFCTCEESIRRDMNVIDEPIILEEWNLKRDKEYYIWSTCRHVSSLDSRIKQANLNVLGFDDNFDYKKHVLSYLDALRINPKIPDYALNIAFTHFSSIFDSMKKDVNEMRKEIGLKDLRMYDDPKVKNYIVGEFLEAGFNPTKLDEVIKAVSY